MSNEVLMPKFVFNDLSTEDEIQAAIESANKPKFFEPGSYDLRIINAEIKGPSKSDPTWVQVTLELQGADGREIKHYLLVPTNSFRFKSANGKETMFIYTKLREFLASIGEEVSADKARTVIPKLFSNPAVLVGRALSVDIGYDGYHIARLADKTYRILDKAGKEVNELTFPDREAAIAAAAELGIAERTGGKTELKRFTSILKFHEAIDKDDNDDWS